MNVGGATADFAIIHFEGRKRIEMEREGGQAACLLEAEVLHLLWRVVL